MKSIHALACISLFAVCAAPADRKPSGDRVEPGLQGQTMPGDLKSESPRQPYSKGVRVAGQTDIRDRGGNINMAWIGTCAYVSSGPADTVPGNMLTSKAADPAKAGVAVIDVSDPRNPKPVRVLREQGALNAAETMHAVEAPDRKVLVAGNYYGTKPGTAWLDIYAASDCTNPKRMSEGSPQSGHARSNRSSRASFRPPDRLGGAIPIGPRLVFRLPCPRWA
jgi:hypothetical protein